jgi:amino acid adenylation domain-containing protein
LRVIDALKNRLTGVRLLLVMGPGNDSIEDVNIRSVSWGDGGAYAVTAPRYRNIDADAAYILYTSGSTGSPKGVIVSHLNVINYIEWSVDFFNIGNEDRILNTAPFYFDMSTFDVFTTLKSGATLCIAPDRCLVFPQKLMDLIEKEGITLWKGVSSLLMYMATTGCLKKDRISSLRKVLFGGEVLPTKHLMNWMKSYPAKQYYNVYGPTEATGISACYPVEKIPDTSDETIPIGTACANTELFVLTEDGCLAGVGETGELCIRGSGLSPGYWNDEEKTARAFIRNPLNRTALHDRVYRTGDLARRREDGLIEYLGRKDFQIKYLGYRIEIFEIEQALLSLDNIHHAAVVLCNSHRGEMAEMVAFVESPEEIVSEAVMRGLNRLLPNYMIPGRIIQLTKMPVTDRGKTDRNLLQNYFQWGQIPERGGIREGARA